MYPVRRHRHTFVLLCLVLAGCSQMNLKDLGLETEFSPMDAYRAGQKKQEENGVERIAMIRFNNALEMDEVEAVRITCSPRFRATALRHASSYDDLKALRIPTGEVEIVSVESISPTEKRVAVAIGESKQKLTAVLTLDESQDEWLIDDLFMKQKKEGVIAVRSVTEQMHLLTSIREFMDTVHSGTREEFLARTTTDLNAALEQVPLPAFEKIQKKVAGGKPSKRLEPDAQLDGERAAVRLHRLSGQLLLTLELEEGQWRVDDLAVESREDQFHIPSVRKTAKAIQTGVNFLQAYQAGDKARLKAVSEKSFYENSLAESELQLYPLPVAELLASDYRIKAQGHNAWIIIPFGEETLTIDLQQPGSSLSLETQTESQAEYLVSEVTRFTGNQEQQLSAVFTSQATMRVFARALEEGNVELLKRLSTPEFARLVWDRADPKVIGSLPLGVLRQGNPKILFANYLGNLTEIRVQQGEAIAVYQVRNWNGKQLVDDVRITTPGQPESLKETLAVMLPVQQFVRGIQSGDLAKIQSTVTGDFNRLVWKHITQVPPVSLVATEYCRQPVGKIDLLGNDAEVQFAGPNNEARILLRKENDVWLIDEMYLLTHGAQPQTAELKKTMRAQLADGTIRPHSMPSFETPSAGGYGTIQPANYEEQVSPNGTSAGQQPTMRSERSTGPVYVPKELQLDQLPEVAIPVQDHSRKSTHYVPTQPISAPGSIPFETKRKPRLNPMSPIWDQPQMVN